MFGSIGIPELLLIFGIVLLLFGAKKLPEVGRGLGRGIKNFKEALSGTSENKPAEKELERTEEKKGED
ncbi:MAG: twin-arginine translocase TatA/TatE family subunit [Acidobacteria bacterium]|nr:twin-arginine translocase TatA/TatE family subunit [Acidobacteriota bacterium]